MNDEKEQRIWNAIKLRAKEWIGFGVMPVKLIIQDGHIVSGEFVPAQETIKIG